MEKFNQLPLKHKILIIFGLTLFAIIIFYPDKEDNLYAPYDAQQGQYAHQQSVQSAAQTKTNENRGSFFSRFGSAQGQQVSFFDRGLQMEVGSQTIPSGWSVNHDIFTNPQTGSFDRYFTELIGSNGEVVRSLGFDMYGQLIGQNFDQTWKRALQNTLRGDLQNLSVGTINRSETIPRSKSYRELLQQGFNADPFEVEIAGTRNGVRYKGQFQIINVQIPGRGHSSQDGMIGTQLILSPENLLAQTIETLIEIDNSFIKNPQHQQRVQQISQANFQQNQQQHQQRMSAQRNQFAEQNRQWSENFFGSWDTGSSSGGSSYSTNDQFLDAITGHSTFDDPHTGYQRQVEGHYRYNYTDGVGNYYGTDDPAFDYRSLQGNWQPISPLRPNN
ncbi:MAG: hypothetical protein JJU37_07260 [Balneolaceae bacterium]|nr:hypothetical protein [Balneolaceae bacterium]